MTTNEEYIILSQKDFDGIRNALNAIMNMSRHGIPEYAFNEACYHIGGGLQECGEAASKTDSMMEEIFESGIEMKFGLGEE